ncbi:hypothetical protein PDESU_03986 [Pontiella desulfatans]|uniref:Thiol:disulfide interchange protein DsbD N-terminal domain-containing protein n=1 Tax=Pontiella desulfatans TaxID=2750659 RepID=A0A6C2U673_PONDE|nr:protein-disulfide reductase DsbD domain-containing protein [Pontiella desulfatans]VGO15403.1 hypothetical protein PDESU_03986 [Pontiella desulfatans]
MKTKRQILALFGALALAHSPLSAHKAVDESLEHSKLPMVSARVVGKELQVIYNIPEGHHATASDSFNFMTIKVSDIQGLEFGETVYPEGRKDADGSTEYHGIVVLKKGITVLPEFDYTPRMVSITAGYQLCTDAGVCMPPKKKTVELTIELPKP